MDLRLVGAATAAVGTSLLLLAGHSVPAMAQSSTAVQSSDLPTIRVQAPKRRAAARRPVRPTRTTTSEPQSAASSNVARGQTGSERANGPVVGYLARQSATGTKTDTPILETPQSISVVTKDQIFAQGAQSLNDALRYTPGVTLSSFGSNTFFDYLKLRGFDAPRYLDGLRLPTDNTTFAVPRVEPYGLERIEVLKGPSSVLYGQIDPGGLINMVSKRPTASPHYEVEGTFGSYERFQGAFDIGGPIDQNGEFLYRITGLGRKSDTQTDFMSDNKLSIAPSFTWRPSVDTTFTILAHYSQIDNKGYQQYLPGRVTFLANPFGRVPYSRYIGEPGPDGFKLEQAAIGYAFEHRFNDMVQFRQNLRYTDVSNDLAATRSEGMIGDRLVARTYNYVKANASNLALDNQFQVDFTTGPFAHKVLFGLDYFNLNADTDYRSAMIAPIDAFAPVYGTPVPSFGSLSPFILRDDHQNQTGMYLQDQIKLDRWVLTVSGRQDWVRSEFDSRAIYPPPGSYSRNDAAATGRVGLNYVFDFGLSPYVSYATSFTPNLGADTVGNSFKPTTGEGVELGAKYQPLGMNLMLTAAVFDIRQKDVLTTSPINPFFSVQTDAVRVRGFEFEAKGNITREFEIAGGYSHLDPKVTESIAGYAGKVLMSTARDQASLWGKYTWFDGPVAGLGLGAGVRYVGPTFGDTFNTFEIPGHTLFDATVSYDFAYLRPDLKGWKAQVNATNLGNRYYVASCLTGLAYCALGTGRTVLGTLKYSWN